MTKETKQVCSDCTYPCEYNTTESVEDEVTKMTEVNPETKYEKWAEDVMQSMLEKHSDPFNAWNYEEVLADLAVKLEADVEVIVAEWFCSDCDYQRMYGQ